jgi:hypothetical protein
MNSGSLSPAVVKAAPRILQIALQLEQDGKLAEVGGLAYLVECVDTAEAARLPDESDSEMGRRLAEELLALQKGHPAGG